MGTVQTVSIATEARTRFLRYAMSVVTGRALPDVRDGLKPVQRRILYTMYHDLNLTRRPQGRQVRQDRRRRDGQLPPARRRCDLRGPRPPVPGLGDAGAARARRRATSAPSMATRPPPTATPRPSSRAPPSQLLTELDAGDGRPPAQLRRHAPRAGRPAGPVPEPARQRHVGHRRRHGDEHPAAQPRRGAPRLRPPDREPGRHGRQPARPREGAGLPARRQDRHRPRARCARSTRRAPAASRCRPSGRRRSSTRASSRSSSRRSPTAWTRANSKATIGAHHRGAQAAAAARPDQRVERQGRPAASCWR